jgi:hypothetical protein
MTLPLARENNIQVEHPVNSNSYDIDFAPQINDDEKDIASIFDEMVDDGRNKLQKYDTVDTYQNKDYFDLNDNNRYGYTEFMDYK